MILGEHCTRNCGFCSVKSGPPDRVDPEEPSHVAEVVEALKLKHVVITSVTRDDLDDGGAAQFAACIMAVRERTPLCRIEVLIPDFRGSEEALMRVIEAKPDIVNHNIETIERLYPKVRQQADYYRSLSLIRSVKKISWNDIFTKSGFMVGLGETDEEIRGLLGDLIDSDCDIVTIGQYLQATRENLEVDRFIPPEQFEKYKEWGHELGFKAVYSGPLVRSSFQADTIWERLENGNN